MEAAGLKINFTLTSAIPHGHASEAAIYKCLQQKFAKPFYRDLILSTGEVPLHERPMRGLGNEWTYPGGDKLGLMLVRLRAEISNEIKNI